MGGTPMTDKMDELRKVSDEVVEDAATLTSLTVENRSTQPGSRRARELGATMESFARRVLKAARREHDLVVELQDSSSADGATIEETPPQE
jgi:TRAP-type mannitol/chloroaromatic compound transport system substrate-binding protein